MILHNKVILYWEEVKFFKQIILDKDNCGFMRTLPSYRKSDKLTIAINSHIGQSNNTWQAFEKSKGYKERQTNEDIEPIDSIQL